MPAAKTTTTNSIPAANAKLAAEVNKLQTKKHKLAEEYKAQEQVEVQGSPFYRPYFGDNMPLQINGISVYVPLDGRRYKIPRTFADLFYRRLSRVDALIQKQGQLSAVFEETYAGEVDLIQAE